MRCEDITEELLARDNGRDRELEGHLADCQVCQHVAHGLNRLNAVLSAALVLEPPRDLQLQLAQLALAAAPPQPVPWWRRLVQGDVNFDWLVPRPNVVVAQGLAAVMLALSGWQIFGWLSTFRPVVGDVGYAMELVAASPAVFYLGGLQFDLQGLGIWSLVGIAGWLVSENGVLGWRLTSIAERFRLP